VWDAIKRFDYAETDRQLGVLATLLAPRDFVHHVALPVMREIGEGWHRGQYSVAQEHMVTAILRNLLGSLVRLHTPARPSQMLLFAAPETDLHDFGLLAAAMLAAGGGMGITFLGPNCPAAEIVRVASKRKPAAVVLSLTAPNHVAHVRRELRRLAAQLPAETELWLSGEQAERATPRRRRSGVLRLNSFEEYEQQLARIGARF
jgi:methylmalonyl-CoA mutase cobalamin-binding subunit